MASAETLVADSTRVASGGGGIPLQLLRHATPTLDDGLADHALARFLAVSLNQVDLLVLAGKYPSKPTFSQDGHPVPGFDGCGVVVQSTSPGFAPCCGMKPWSLGSWLRRSDRRTRGTGSSCWLAQARWPNLLRSLRATGASMWRWSSEIVGISPRRQRSCSI